MERFITVSEAALHKINEVISTNYTADTKFRITVLSGGCSGFQYKYTFEDKINNDDLFFGKGDIVIADPLSLDFIQGGELDYFITLGEEGFKINNPNSKTKCGCGNSFSIEI